MGENIVEYYQTKVKKEYKYAFFAGFLMTLLIHAYKFLNTLPNHDSLTNFYSDQNIVGSGRWALSLACGISSYYDLPWINGLMCCLFIGLTAVILVALFKIRNPVVITLVGGLLAASPSTTETFFFLFTADGYMLSMALAALAVYLSRIEEKRLLPKLLAGLCICISCAIYQAYVSFALVLAVCYFIDVLLSDTASKKECFRWIRLQILLYAAALGCYYVIWKLTLRITNIPVNDYQGIAEVGKLNVGLLLGGLLRSIQSTVLYFLQWNVLDHGWTPYAALNVIFLAFFALGLIAAFVRSSIRQRKWAVGLVILCLVAIIPFACIWHFTSDAIEYRAMMLQCFTLLFVLGAVLCEKWGKLTSKNLVGLLLVGIIFQNALMANIGYFYMNLGYERTYGEAVEMVCRIHEIQADEPFDQVAVIGNRAVDVQWISVDDRTGERLPSSSIHMLSGLIEKNMLYDIVHIASFLEFNLGAQLKFLPPDEAGNLTKLDSVDQMGCWPASDCMMVVDDTLIIKLSDQIP